MLNEDGVRKEVCRVAESSGGVRALARRLGVSPSYVSDVCTGRRSPGPPFLKFLRLKKVVRYVKA
jgi:hypothetical protein